MRQLMNQWLDQVMYALIPGTCILCEGRTRRNLDLCRSCERQLPWLGIEQCHRCALPIAFPDTICGSCLETPPLWSECFAAFEYRYPIDRLIGEFKQTHRLLTGKVLAALLASAFMRQRSATSLPELLVPVPLHKSKLRQRGYNQAAEIAEVLADRFHVPMDNRLCRKIRETGEQKTLDAPTRALNLRHAFQLDHDIQGIDIGLVDDVLTTGATAHELTRLLLQGGAASVQVIVLARTPRRA